MASRSLFLNDSEKRGAHAFAGTEQTVQNVIRASTWSTNQFYERRLRAYLLVALFLCAVLRKEKQTLSDAWLTRGGVLRA